MSMEAKVRPWLLIVLLAVIIIGGGFTYWYVYADKGTTATKTSPTPTKSAALSPTAGMTTTPTSGKTSTPTSGTTATPVPTITPTSEATPPTGWKVEQNYLSSGGGAVYGGYYQLFIKDNWIDREDTAFATWPHHIMFYGDGPNCGSTIDGVYKEEDCIFKIGGRDFTIEFYPGKISDSDKQIVLDSFKKL